MAFQREVECEITTSDNTSIKTTELFMTFDIKRTLLLTSNSAVINIYNAKEDTRNKIFKKGNTINFKAGHKDEKNLASIFSGIIYFSNPKKEGTEIISELTCIDIPLYQNGANFGYVSYSYKEKTQIKQIFSDLADELNLSLFGKDNLTETLNSNFTYVGSIGGLLRELRNIIKASDCEVYLDAGSMVIYKIGKQISKFGIVKMPSKNIIGNVRNIIDSSKQDKRKRIGFTCILNPKIKPNALVNMQSKDVKGTYITELAHYVGDNGSGIFCCDVEAAE